MTTTKKGQAADLMIILFLMFTIAIIGLISWVGYSQMYQGFVDAGVDDRTLAGVNEAGKFYTSYDSLTVFVVIAVMILVFVTAWFLPSHPIFSFFMIIVAGILTLPAVLFINSWDIISQSDAFSTYAADFPITDAFMPFLGVFICGMGVMYGIVSLSRSQGVI